MLEQQPVSPSILQRWSLDQGSTYSVILLENSTALVVVWLWSQAKSVSKPPPCSSQVIPLCGRSVRWWAEFSVSEVQCGIKLKIHYWEIAIIHTQNNTIIQYTKTYSRSVTVIQSWWTAELKPDSGWIQVENVELQVSNTYCSVSASFISWVNV